MARIAAVPDLEQELDALFALPGAEFTKARNDLAARLKKAHQDEAAAQIRALKKPTVVAAAANTLVRSEPKLVVSLLRAGDRLREAQQRALAGNARPQEVNDAASAERDAIRELVAAARTLLSGPSLDKLSQTLRAAAVDPASRALLERGRFTEELKAVGFGPLEGIEPGPRQDDAAAQRKAERERLRKLREEARRLTAEARDAEHAAEHAAQEAERLARVAVDAREAAERAAAALEDADRSD